jgi:hypothetical protein
MAIVLRLRFSLEATAVDTCAQGTSVAARARIG